MFEPFNVVLIVVLILYLAIVMNGPAAFESLNGIFCVYKRAGLGYMTHLKMIKEILSAGNTHVI